jgi:hypothetical protein
MPIILHDEVKPLQFRLPIIKNSNGDEVSQQKRNCYQHWIGSGSRIGFGLESGSRNTAGYDLGPNKDPQH